MLAGGKENIHFIEFLMSLSELITLCEK